MRGESQVHRSSVGLSILVPVYNEAYTVEQVLTDALAVALPAGVEREIVAVDDASTDGTGKILDEFAATHALVRVIHHARNLGKGAAVRTAIEQAQGTICIIQDADLEYDPRDYPRLLQPILNGEADVVYGSRFAASAERRVLMFWHSVGNRVLTNLSNMLTNLNLTDMETGYKAVRSEILKSIPIRCNRFGIEPELTAKLAKRGCRIYEVPISYRGRSYLEGKKITWRDGIKALGVMVYFRLVDDLYAGDYGKSILTSLSETQRFNRWMAEQIRPYVGEEVLEIGAGLGNMTRQFMPRRRYVVSDIDPLYLGYLRNVHAHQRRVAVARIDVADAADFSGFQATVDTVICLNVIEHVQDDMAALRNIAGALKAGGCACVLVPRGMELFGSLDTALGHCRRYTRDELDQKMKAAGFEVERMFTFNRLTVPAWWINGRRLHRRHFGKIQLKLFDSMVWLWRIIDRLLPWQGISLIAIGRKTGDRARGKGSCSVSGE